jgi:ABC-type Na+ efflux pump permease subunit
VEEIKIISILVLIPIFMACATVVGVGSITKTPEEFKEYFKKYTPVMIIIYFIIFLILYYVKY